MAATAKQLEALAAPTPPEEIGTLPGRANKKSGTTSPDMSYITARFTMDRADEAVGPANWATDFRRDDTGRLYVGVGIRVWEMTPKGDGETYEWVWKWDTGEESSIEAGKGEFSDALKRAWVHWGVGRDLYPSPNKKTAKVKPAQSAKSKPQRDPGEDEEVSAIDPEADVVGKEGLTKKQKALLFATLRDAGVPDDKRKKLVHTITGKWSTADMDNDDLDLVLAFAKDGEYSEEDE
jgi:hypothetical protein